MKKKRLSKKKGPHLVSMKPQQKLEILLRYPLFENLDRNQLLILSQRAVEKTFPPHSIILDQDKPANSVLLIYKGLIKIFILTKEGRVVPIRTVGPMYITGELNIVDYEKNTTIEAIQATHALSIDLQDCRRLLDLHPNFGKNLLKIIVEKLRVANQQTEYYFCAPLKDRTWNNLQTLANHFPNKEITLSQEELADIVGATRAKVGEALQELQNQRLISRQYKKIQVL